jgi:SAM-dependent methyltransferase
VNQVDVRALFDRAAATYDIAAFPFFTLFGEAFVEFAQLGADDRVLDAGCGTGAVLAPAARVAASVTGIELSEAMARRAREAAPRADVVVGDAAALPFEDGSFDVVLAGFVIFFMDDPTAVLREWRRVLAPGGRLAISTWGDADPRWQFERDIRKDFIPQLPPELLPELGQGLELLGRFDEPAKVEDELRGAGFAPDDVREHTIEFHFADERAWWDWNWSHGSRVFLEPLPEAARADFRARVAAALESIRDERGIPRTYTALFSSATLA